MPDTDSDIQGGARDFEPPPPAEPKADAAPAAPAGEANGAAHSDGRRFRRGRRNFRDRRRGRRPNRPNGQANAQPNGQAEGQEQGAGQPDEHRPEQRQGQRKGHTFAPRLRQNKGGIKVQSKKFGESWWAKRWLAVLENMRMGTRLERGKSYARSGQVLSVEVQKGVVIAQVQGSRPKPYQVRIGVKGMSHKEWYRLARAVSSQAIFAAKLLSGEMPREIEQAFRREGLSLFPTRLSDLKTSCTCPDWSNPCKHIAAVYYLLGEEFDRDPFLIFKMRGMSREEFMALLGGRKVEMASEVLAGEEEAAEVEVAEPLPENPDTFWARKAAPENLLGESTDIKPAALLDRVGQFPFWRGSDKFLDTLRATYTTASQRVKQTITEF
ncbi:MAG: hypothetical protein FJW39_17020 [Acidobacteria bacterium]|nr:hypothetical protein [Acidobacteriota bacterium]